MFGEGRLRVTLFLQTFHMICLNKLGYHLTPLFLHLPRLCHTRSPAGPVPRGLPMLVSRSRYLSRIFENQNE